MEKKYTDDDVNCILSHKFARWQKKIRKMAAENQRLDKINKSLSVQCEDMQKEINQLRSKQIFTELLIDMIRKGTACSNQ